MAVNFWLLFSESVWRMEVVPVLIPEIAERALRVWEISVARRRFPQRRVPRMREMVFRERRIFFVVCRSVFCVWAIFFSSAYCCVAASLFFW